MTRAVAYLRTSSATNVGGDKDSDKRQRDAIMEYAQRNGYEIEREFYDAGVSGTDHVMDREGFSDLFAYVEERRTNMPVAGVGWQETCTTILIENASRFSRDLSVQIAGYDMLRKHGITLIPVDAPNHFLEDTPTAVMVRNILGAVSQFEKDNLVSKLRKARERRKAVTGKCEGRKSYKELYPEVVEEAKRLRRLGRTHRQVAEQLMAAGFRGPHPDSAEIPWSTQAISAMVRQ